MEVRIFARYHPTPVLIDAGAYSSWDLHVTSSCHRIKIYSVNRSRPATMQRLKELEARGEGIEPLSKPLEFQLEDTEEYLAACKKHPREPLN